MESRDEVDFEEKSMANGGRYPRGSLGILAKFIKLEYKGANLWRREVTGKVYTNATSELVYGKMGVPGSPFPLRIKDRLLPSPGHGAPTWPACEPSWYGRCIKRR
jgi:hypothetical protein